MRSDIIYGQSYLLESGRRFASADSLGELIAAPEGAGIWTKPQFKEIGMYAIDLLEKLGYMHYALEELDECSNRMAEYTYGKYHFYSFLFFSKATLDTAAVMFNEIFNLNLKGGELDLGGNKFLQRATEVAPEFVQLVKIHRGLKAVRSSDY